MANPPTPTKATATPPETVEVVYPCVGICMADPDSGLCQGCGRPLAEPETPADGLSD